MFGKREPNQLRERLGEIERDLQLGKLDKEAGNRQRGEVLSALKHLGEKLNPLELELLEKLSLGSIANASFVQVDDSQDKSKIALAAAGKEIRATQGV